MLRGSCAAHAAYTERPARAGRVARQDRPAPGWDPPGPAPGPLPYLARRGPLWTRGVPSGAERCGPKRRERIASQSQGTRKNISGVWRPSNAFFPLRGGGGELT